MKKRLEFKDIYLYARVGYHLVNGVGASVEDSPYSRDGRRIDVEILNDVVSGYGRRNWQRDAIERSRGLVIAVVDGYNRHIIGRKAKTKPVEIFTTAEAGSLEMEITLDLIDHLEYNEVEFILSSDKRAQFKCQKRFDRGDRVTTEVRR